MDRFYKIIANRQFKGIFFWGAALVMGYTAETAVLVYFIISSGQE